MLDADAQGAEVLGQMSKTDTDTAHDLASIVLAAASDDCMRPAALYESSDLLRALLAVCMPVAAAGGTLYGHPLLVALASTLGVASESAVRVCVQDGVAPVATMADVRAPPHRQLAACLPLLCQLCEAAAQAPDCVHGGVLQEPTLRATLVAYALAVLEHLDFAEARTLACRCAPLAPNARTRRSCLVGSFVSGPW